MLLSIVARANRCSEHILNTIPSISLRRCLRRRRPFFLIFFFFPVPAIDRLADLEEHLLQGVGLKDSVPAIEGGRTMIALRPSASRRRDSGTEKPRAVSSSNCSSSLFVRLIVDTQCLSMNTIAGQAGNDDVKSSKKSRKNNDNNKLAQPSPKPEITTYSYLSSLPGILSPLYQ